VDDAETVLLGIRCSGIADTGMVDDIGKTFSGFFDQSQHLDIAFLSENQERAAAAVCPPFYERRTPTPRQD